MEASYNCTLLRNLSVYS